MPNKLTKQQIIDIVGIDTDNYLAFSMWAERNQEIYITKKERVSSGMYRGYTSGLFKDEHDALIHKNIELLLPKYLKVIENHEKLKPLVAVDHTTKVSEIALKASSGIHIPIPNEEWERQSSTQLKKQLRDPKGYSKEDRKTIRAILKKRRKRLKGGK